MKAAASSPLRSGSARIGSPAVTADEIEEHRPFIASAPPATPSGTPSGDGRCPTEVFFACGACHILAYAFLDRYRLPGGRAVWIKPHPGLTGNHIVVAGDGWVFDYHGYAERERYLTHTLAKARRWWPGWDASLHELPMEVLVSETLSRRYEGLWLQEPGQFLHDAMPRARTYLDRFAPPRDAGVDRSGAAGKNASSARELPPWTSSRR